MQKQVRLHPILTESDLCLHGHRQRRVLDFAAEQSIVIQLRVECPGESSLHHHRAIALGDVSVAKVVERVCAVHPAGKLPANHGFWDHLCGRAGLGGLLAVSVDALRVLRVQVGRATLGVQEGQGPLQLGVVEVPADEWPGSSHAGHATC